MEIELLHVADCPNRALARARLDQALASAQVVASVREVRVGTSDDAERLGMAGSPTLLVDGRDPFGASTSAASLSCRLYRHGDELDGAPSVEELVGVMGGHTVGDDEPRAVLASPSGDTRAVAAWAFERLLEGHAVERDELVSATGMSTERVHAALRELDVAGRLEVDGDGAVVGAHGVTLRETSHRIEHALGAVHTWCAFDAVGIPAARRIDALITSSCPDCHTQIELAVTAGDPAASELVLWMPPSVCANVLRDFCANANLFCSREHLERWRAGAGDPPGEVIAPAEAAQLGLQAWADVAAPTDGGSLPAFRAYRDR